MSLPLFGYVWDDLQRAGRDKNRVYAGRSVKSANKNLPNLTCDLYYLVEARRSSIHGRIAQLLLEILPVKAGTSDV
jgi:hypothetical protein